MREEYSFCGTSDHVWLFVDRFDDRVGSDTIARLVVAG